MHFKKKDDAIITLKQKNCLNTIRLIAAMQVMIGHSIAHLDSSLPLGIEIFLKYFPGVPIFFALSGFLIWNSIENTNTYTLFLKKRFLRIYPELWVGVLIEIICILVFYKQHVSLIKLGFFAITQGTILQFWTPTELNGYGCGTPNGSLWTICTLIQFYIVVWGIYKVLHKKNVKIWISTIIVSIVYGNLILGHLAQ